MSGGGGGGGGTVRNSSRGLKALSWGGDEAPVILHKVSRWRLLDPQHHP
jgi:hypothetical protein